jgi:hypothetical protein
MRFKELLLEYNKEFTMKTYGKPLFDIYVKSPDIPKHIKSELSAAKNSPDITQIIENAVRKLLSDLEKGDPTRNKKYMPWIVREYIKGNIKRLEDLDQLAANLGVYDRVKSSIEFLEFISDYIDIDPMLAKNIMNLSYNIIRQAMPSYVPQKVLVDKGDSTEVYNDSEVRVIMPLNEKAACYYGQGTVWCTSATDSRNYFEHYNTRGNLYILLPKVPKYKGEKYQLHISSGQFADENDSMYSLETLQGRFPGFSKWLLTNASESDRKELKGYLAITPDAELKKLWNLIFNAVLEKAWEMIDESAHDDDYYQSQLIDIAKKHGLEYPADVDELEKLENTSLDYLSYNDDCATFIKDLQEINNRTVAEIRENIDDYIEAVSQNSDEVTWIGVSDLTSVAANAIFYLGKQLDLYEMAAEYAESLSLLNNESITLPKNRLIGTVDDYNLYYPKKG